MIHMLSRFDLRPGIDPAGFQTSYVSFVEHMKAAGLVESTGQIRQRVADTPMDTDNADAPLYYVVMSFKDRTQLDQAYAHITTPQASEDAGHPSVHQAVDNFVFTCWEDIDHGDGRADLS